MNLALVGILESIMIGLMATFFGIILAFPVSFLAARNLMMPIMSKTGGVVGGFVGLVPGIWAAIIGTQYVISLFGGLEQAPIIIAIIMVILFLGLGGLGWRLGAWIISQLIEALPVSIGRGVIGFSFAALAATPGYLLGLGFSRGILSIPLSVEVAAVNEQTYAIIGAVILGVAGAAFGYFSGNEGEVSIGALVYAVTRTILNIVRSIEPIIWALVAVIWVGLGPFAGTIALTLHTIAALGKLYSESIESIDPGPIEALQATGANRLQTIVYAVVPQILPPFISFTIYRWDINVRMSTIIGAVGGGGIGFILIQWIRLFQYDAVGLGVWLIAVTVALLDFVSSNIRARYV
ncbi:MAG: ABC transporter permease subunit [Chloroflexi bacterium]|nr:MAG: ABC transporter permease subunit [Chloroflexota bacterium]MBL1197312.1 ABC transporter permease subunit [Chloroflexota bacterium]NOH14608.1 ABC transporter permease subunit [Chloroflexota bacterium]